MSKQTVEALVEGGKASAAPPLGPALGPLKVNIGQVIDEINKKTTSFKGMKVPVKVIVDTKTKEFTIEVGTPPMSQLIKKELGLEKASTAPSKEIVANIAIEQVIKIAKMKQDTMFINSLKSAIKTVIGSCNSMGILVEGKNALEINKEIDEGSYYKEIKEERTEVSQEKQERLKNELEEIKQKLKAELEKLEAEEKPKVEEKKEEAEEEKKEEKPKEEITKKEEKPKKK